MNKKLLTKKQKSERNFKRKKIAMTIIISIIIAAALAVTIASIITPNESVADAAILMNAIILVVSIPSKGLSILNTLKATYINQQKMNELEIVKLKKLAEENKFFQSRIKKFVSKKATIPMLDDYIIAYCKNQNKELKGITFYQYQSILNDLKLTDSAKVKAIVSLLKTYGVLVSKETETTLYSII